MARPQNKRIIAGRPRQLVFKPAGVPASALDETVLTLDELEALRLADLEGLYQDDAAAQMDVSRQTFGRIVAAARKKVAQALVQGKALRIEGGRVELAETRTFNCRACGHTWELPFGTGRPESCPTCGNGDIRRAPTGTERVVAIVDNGQDIPGTT